VSFLLHSDHNFALAPYEEITKEAYEKLLSKVDFSVPLYIPKGIGEMDMDDCATGACPIK
jgi:hypothetical protein